MDFERIQMLLAVASATLDYPNLRNIHNAAVDELSKHNDGTIDGPWPPAEPDEGADTLGESNLTAAERTEATHRSKLAAESLATTAGTNHIRRTL